MSSRASVEARKRQKMREIQRRLPYMRATNPPSTLFYSTSRAALETQNKELRPVPNIIDQLIQKGILQDEYFDQLKNTLKGNKRAADGPNSPTINTSSQRLQLAGAQSMSPTSRSPRPTATPQLSINITNPTIAATAQFSHPLVATLAERDLTPIAKLRKIQAKIRSEVEEKMFGSGSSK